jgi:putative ABC transport system substrate-binding protein
MITSLSHPGGNITGLTNMAAELGGRRVQLLHDMIPGIKRVAALASREDVFTKPFLDYMEQAAPANGVRLISVKVDGPADFERAFATMAKRGRTSKQATASPAMTVRNRENTMAPSAGRRCWFQPALLRLLHASI